MPQKTYMYDTQWNQLINAIGTGDSSAVVTALSTIKTSLDNINTQLNTIDFNTTQWTALLNAIRTGDSSAVVTALNTIKNSLDNITSAISSQTITVDLSNINSDNVVNLSDINGTNITNVLNRISNNSLWKLIVNVEIPNTNNTDVTIPITYPYDRADITDIMFLLLRKSNMRVFASTICPFDIWTRHAMYAAGTYTLYSGIFNSYAGAYINGVCIDGGESIEIAVNRPIEDLIAMVYVKGKK